MTDIERAKYINKIALALARFRMDDTTCTLPADQIVTPADFAFALRLVRFAAPLYPLPEQLADLPVGREHPMFVDLEDA